MALNRTKFDRDYCAAGEKRFQELDPTFRAMPPVPNGKKGRKDRTAICLKCDQRTRVKLTGFFVRHKSSVKGHVPANFKGSGIPERVRGRSQL
jgi:hypothetical protein